MAASAPGYREAVSPGFFVNDVEEQAFSFLKKVTVSASAASHGCHLEASVSPGNDVEEQAAECGELSTSAASHGCHPPEASVSPVKDVEVQCGENFKLSTSAASHGCQPPEASVSPVNDVAGECFSIFGEKVRLPPGSFVSNEIGKIAEVGRCGTFPSELVQALQNEHPELLIELVDDFLVFQMPSSNATDSLNLFDSQIQAYISRHGRTDLAQKSSSALFHVPGQTSRVCADYTVHGIQGYDAKLDAAIAKGRTVPEDVPVYLTIEMQSLTQSEQLIRDTCAKEALWLNRYNCISVALLVKTGFIEIYDSTGRRHMQYNPRYIDVGMYSPHLRGLRLYLQCLRDQRSWRHPSPHNFHVEGAVPHLLAAISANDFELAEEVLNFMFSSHIEDVRPMVVSVEKATQHVPGAFQFVRYLLDNGAVVDGQDVDGVSPYLVAIAEGNQQLISLLSHSGAAHINVSTPMLLSALDKQRSKLASLLIKAGCRPTADMLVKVVRMGNVELTRLLIQAGCNPDIADSDGCLPLREAISKVEMVSALFESAKAMGMEYPRVHKKDVDGISPWDAAMQRGKREVMDCLKNYGEQRRNSRLGKVGAIIKKVLPKKKKKMQP